MLHDKFNDPEWAKTVKAYFKDPEMNIKRSHCFNLQMFDSFFHFGPNGKHFVMAFEVLGTNFLKLMKKYDYDGIPIPMVR